MTILARETGLSRAARVAGLALLLAPDWRDDEILLGRWVTGFVDGEGCFGAYEDACPSRRKKGWENRSVYAALYIQLRADDRPVLARIRDYFGCGQIASHSRKAEREQGFPNRQDQASFRIRRVVDLYQRVVPHFDRFPLQSKKRQDYEIWREIVELGYRAKQIRKWAKNSPEKARLFHEMRCLAAELRDVRKYRRRS